MFWFTDDDGENIMSDHHGNIRGAITKAKQYLRQHPECERIYINKDEYIVTVVFHWEI